MFGFSSSNPWGLNDNGNAIRTGTKLYDNLKTTTVIRASSPTVFYGLRGRDGALLISDVDSRRPRKVRKNERAGRQWDGLAWEDRKRFLRGAFKQEKRFDEHERTVGTRARALGITVNINIARACVRA